MKIADKLNTKIAVIIGEDEIKNNEFTVKELKTSKQLKIPQNELLNFIKKNLK